MGFFINQTISRDSGIREKETEQRKLLAWNGQALGRSENARIAGGKKESKKKSAQDPMGKEKEKMIRWGGRTCSSTTCWRHCRGVSDWPIQEVADGSTTQKKVAEAG